MGIIDGNFKSNPIRTNHPVDKPEPVKKQPNPDVHTNNTAATLKSELQNYGQQQKERLEKLYAAGAGGALAVKDVGLMRATNRANQAYDKVYSEGLKSGKNWIEVSRNAESAYRTELHKSGYTASDVRGTSFAKAVDLINSEAVSKGNFTTLSADGVLGRVNNEPKYVVRIIDQPKYLESAKSTIAGKTNVWFATAEEIAGAKKNVFEIMQRIGYTPEDIKQARADIKSGKKSISDYHLFIAEAEGTKSNGIPKWDRLIDEVHKMNAAGEPNFKDFSKSRKFWQKVENLDFEKVVKRANQKGLKIEDYAARLPKTQQDVVLARLQVKETFTATEMYTGKGYTRRADGQNGGMGIPERWIENFELHSQRRNTFIPLDNNAKSTKVDTIYNLRTIAENPLNLRGEMKSGGIAGGAFSAVTSLPEVFDQAKRGDFKGAATTLAVNTGGGATLGALSSGGERIVGRGLENALSRSNLAEKGLERLYESGAARSFAGRLAGTEASNVSSQAFNSTLRTMAGRVGGAGVVGGLVSGGFAAYDQIGAYKRGEVSGSQAIGTVTGEAAVGVGAGMAGAAAGAAIGSIIPGAGTIVGGVIGFGVGMAAGYLADKGLRGLGVNTAIAKGVTATIDAGSRLAGTVHKQASQAVQAGRQYVSQKVTQAKAVYRSASTAVKTARAYVGQKLDNARQRVSGATRAAVNYVSQAKDRAVQTVRNAANQVRSTVSSAVSQARSTVSNVANQARATVSNAVNNLAGGAVSNLKSVFGW